MPTPKRQRLLVAEDDARWLRHVFENPDLDATTVTNLADALALIDRRRRWNGAVFDRYLLDGDTPFEPGKLISEAGFILAVAFKERFPESRVCICSGDPDTSSIPDHLRQLIDHDLVAYIYKGAANAESQFKRFLNGEKLTEPSVGFLKHLLLEPNFFGIGINLQSVIDAIRIHRRKANQ